MRLPFRKWQPESSALRKTNSLSARFSAPEEQLDGGLTDINLAVRNGWYSWSP